MEGLLYLKKYGIGGPAFVFLPGLFDQFESKKTGPRPAIK